MFKRYPSAQRQSRVQTDFKDARATMMECAGLNEKSIDKRKYS